MVQHVEQNWNIYQLGVTRQINIQEIYLYRALWIMKKAVNWRCTVLTLGAQVAQSP